MSLGSWLLGILLLHMALSSCGDAEAPSETTQRPPSMDPRVEEGERLFMAHRCWFCHQVVDAPPKLGPNLTRTGSELSRDDLTVWIQDPKKKKPDTTMPRFTGPETELNLIVTYLLTLK